MKQFIIFLMFLLIAFSGYSQFKVRVTLKGNCIQPDQNTYYVVKVDIENTQNSTTVETQTITTPTTNYSGYPVITVQLNTFCTADNTPKYKIHVNAAKVYLSPPSVICNEKKDSSTYSCDQFCSSNPGYIDVGDIYLQ